MDVCKHVLRVADVGAGDDSQSAEETLAPLVTFDLLFSTREWADKYKTPPEDGGRGVGTTF